MHSVSFYMQHRAEEVCRYGSVRGARRVGKSLPCSIVIFYREGGCLDNYPRILHNRGIGRSVREYRMSS